MDDDHSLNTLTSINYKLIAMLSRKKSKPTTKGEANQLITCFLFVAVKKLAHIPVCVVYDELLTWNRGFKFNCYCVLSAYLEPSYVQHWYSTIYFCAILCWCQTLHAQWSNTKAINVYLCDHWPNVTDSILIKEWLQIQD